MHTVLRVKMHSKFDLNYFWCQFHTTLLTPNHCVEWYTRGMILLNHSTSFFFFKLNILHHNALHQKLCSIYREKHFAIQIIDLPLDQMRIYTYFCCVHSKWVNWLDCHFANCVYIWLCQSHRRLLYWVREFKWKKLAVPKKVRMRRGGNGAIYTKYQR